MVRVQTLRTSLFTAGLALALAQATIAGAPDALAEDTVAAREWEQEGGGPDHACTSTMVPVAGPPIVAWTQALPGPILSEPVASNGVVYLVVANKDNAELVAYRAADGTRAATRVIGSSFSTFRVAVSRGVAIVNADGVRGFPLRADGFALGWRSPTPATNGMVVQDGVIFAGSPKSIIRLSASNGKMLEERICVGGGSIGGIVLCDVSEPGGAAESQISYVRDGYKERVTARFAVTARAAINAKGGIDDPIEHLTDLVLTPGDARWEAFVRVTKRANPYIDPSALFVLGPGYPAASGPDAPSAVISVSGRDVSLCSIATRPAVADGRIHGFNAQGALIAVEADGTYYTLIEPGTLPKGARMGPATLVGTVLCFGNWAVDKDSKRVLWTVPEIDPASPAIPVADGRLVVVDADGPATFRLVCLADPSVAAPPTAAPSAAASAAAPRPPSPDGLDGLILADGTIVAGQVEKLPTGPLRLTPTSGPAREFAVDAVSVALAKGAVVHRGEQFGAFDAWDERLRAEAADVFEGLARKAASERLFATTRRLAEAAKSFGLDDARSRQIDSAMAGFTEAANAAAKDLRYVKLEDEARTKLRGQALAASAWLADRGLPAAAAAAIQLAERFRSDAADSETRAAGLVPPSFPWKSERDAGARWIRWSGAILASGAEFIPPDDAAWGRIRGEQAWRLGTIGFRTRNLLLFSRCQDVDVVGPCLRNGEGAIRALDELFRGGVASAIRNDADRLEVRVHANREEYLAERPPTGGGAIGWSAGYYSPGENVSRFYVPTGAETEAARGRSLFKVLTHELTHHYVERRWTGGDRSGGRSPGYWVVEGIAEFVEDQTVEMGRRGLRFDDTTVESLDSSAQLEAAGLLLRPVGRFLDLSYGEFVALGDTPEYEVKLRNTLVTYKLSKISIFYRESAALVFWLMHRRGPEGRAALLGAIRDYYAGKARPGGWAALGFKDAESFEREFRAFLKSLR
ncbi:MAG: PQQ-binding-like beta-propeller repeat protein [Planctomycetes bacterium]|nr:PQQ-binding-like beta-propeller repeat protein [Planctomycetota bacterium]